MAKGGGASSSRGRKTCCLVSEQLEEMGLDSRTVREIRRQALIGLITFCQWQLTRIGEGPQSETDGTPRKAKGRRVRVV